MLTIPLRNGTEYEIPTAFLAELDLVFYGVETECYRMRLWCLANPDRRKTKRGARRFVFNWINKACQVRPIAKAKTATLEVHRPAMEPIEVRQERLAKLKGALK